jgi:nucleoid DNA-binding protein
MNKKDIVDLVSKKTMTAKQAKEIVDCVFDGIAKSLKGKDKVIISGFGTFELKEVKEKIGRNPKTGERVVIPERHLLRFKPSKTFYN